MICCFEDENSKNVMKALCVTVWIRQAVCAEENKPNTPEIKAITTTPVSPKFRCVTLEVDNIMASTVVVFCHTSKN